jgi:alanine racemase
VAAAARALSRRAEVHLKIDTGLHRLGTPPGEAADLARRVTKAGLRLGGVWTHLATADDPHGGFVEVQLGAFAKAVQEVEAAGGPVPCRHVANSAAALAVPGSRLDLVRVGALLYGIRPAAGAPGADRFRPVLTWRSSVATARAFGGGECVSYGRKYRLDGETTIAVVPVGFGDGLPRLLGNRGHVLIGGRRRRIAGAVGMSHIMVDCGDDPVGPGEPVVIIGRQGAEEIGAEEIAQWSGSSAYEVLTRISRSVPRIHAMDSE